MSSTRIKVTYKGRSYEAANFLDYTENTRNLYEKEVDVPTKNGVIISLFEMSLHEWDKMFFVTHKPYQKLAIAKAWYRTSVGLEFGEEPNVIY